MCGTVSTVACVSVTVFVVLATTFGDRCVCVGPNLDKAKLDRKDTLINVSPSAALDGRQA